MSAPVARRPAPRARREPSQPYRLADLMAVDAASVALLDQIDYARRRLWLFRWLETEQERLEAAGLVTADAVELRAWRERLREYEALCRLAPEIDGEE